MYFVPDIFLLFTTCARLVEIRLRALYQVQATMQPDEDRLDLPPPSHALSVTPWPNKYTPTLPSYQVLE